MWKDDAKLWCALTNSDPLQNLENKTHRAPEFQSLDSRTPADAPIALSVAARYATGTTQTTDTFFVKVWPNTIHNLNFAIQYYIF